MSINTRYDMLPMVSVSMLVYNHEKYIKQALESILMQKVNFNYEIVIAEDCSLDNSRQIILDYKRKYPSKIKLILQPKNVGSKENARLAIENCIGRYKAVCEGDDYWVDPYKLQKQVDYLESHPEYVGIANKIRMVDSDNNFKKFRYEEVFCVDTEYTLKHAEKMLMPGHLSALMHRNIFLEMDTKSKNVYFANNAEGDRKLGLLLALYGKVYCDNSVVSHYRRITSEGTSWSALNEDRNRTATAIRWTKQLSKLAKQGFNIDLDYSRFYRNLCYPAFARYLKNPNKENLKMLQKTFGLSKSKLSSVLYILRMLCSWPLRTLKRAMETD